MEIKLDREEIRLALLKWVEVELTDVSAFKIDDCQITVDGQKVTAHLTGRLEAPMSEG